MAADGMPSANSDAHHSALTPLNLNTHWRLQGMKLPGHSDNYAHGN